MAPRAPTPNSTGSRPISRRPFRRNRRLRHGPATKYAAARSSPVVGGFPCACAACSLCCRFWPPRGRPTLPIPRPTPSDSEKGSFSILFENDIFYNSDHDYTNGVEFSYTTAPNDTPDWAARATRALFHDEGDVRARYAFGQDIFTPNNLSLTNPPLTDRPYAGFLYGALGLVEDTGSDLDQLQFTLGVVGPASLAEESQKVVHAIFNDRKPMG